LRQRIVALAAAYVIALSSLVASFGVARAAAETSGVPGDVICHTLAPDQQAPNSDRGSGKICEDCCSSGCLMAMAALPPPPANTVMVLHSVPYFVAPPPVIALAGSREVKSHRSRAPPQTM
jgi:hypothetical protein